MSSTPRPEDEYPPVADDDGDQYVPTSRELADQWARGRREAGDARSDAGHQREPVDGEDRRDRAVPVGAAADPTSGDAASGDAASGETGSGDAASGDAVSGEAVPQRGAGGVRVTGGIPLDPASLPGPEAFAATRGEAAEQDRGSAHGRSTAAEAASGSPDAHDGGDALDDGSSPAGASPIPSSVGPASADSVAPGPVHAGAVHAGATSSASGSGEAAAGGPDGAGAAAGGPDEPGAAGGEPDIADAPRDADRDADLSADRRRRVDHGADMDDWDRAFAGDDDITFDDSSEPSATGVGGERPEGTDSARTDGAVGEEFDADRADPGRADRADLADRADAGSDADRADRTGDEFDVDRADLADADLDDGRLDDPRVDRPRGDGQPAPVPAGEGVAAAGGATAASAAVPAPATSAGRAEPIRETDPAGRAEPTDEVGRHGDTEQTGHDEEAQRRASRRDAALDGKPAAGRFWQVVVAIAFPVVLLAAAIRTVASPLFVWIEYHRPGFPADPYGFTADDRLTWGSAVLDYVNNFANPRYLAELPGKDGGALLTESEIRHMVDVKNLFGITYIAAAVLLVLALIGVIYLAKRYLGGVRRGLFAGSVITLVVVLALGVFAVLDFALFFTTFHRVFFSQGNWTFYENDGLIRLFPEQFWADSGLLIGVIVLGVSIVTLLLTWPTRRRRERSRSAQDALRRTMAAHDEETVA